MGLRGFVAVLALCVLGVSGCAHGVPVMNPDPIAAAATPETTEMAILDALPRRRWTAEDVKPGRIVAFLPVKSYLVRAEIVYDQNQVRIHYVNSDNLSEEMGPDGRVYAHKAVNKWLRVLAVDIARSLADTAGAAPVVSTGGLGSANPDAAAGGEQPVAAPLLGSALEQPASASPATGAQPSATVPVAPK